MNVCLLFRVGDTLTTQHYSGTQKKHSTPNKESVSREQREVGDKRDTKLLSALSITLGCGVGGGEGVPFRITLQTASFLLNEGLI